MISVSGTARMKLPPSADERFDAAVAHALAGFDRVEAALARGIEAVLLREPVERHQLRLLGDADRALALHVGMAAYGEDAGARFADVAAQEQQVAQHLDGEHAGAVLRETHAVAGDGRFGVAVDARRRFDVGPRQARAGLDVRPLELAHGRAKASKPLVSRAMKSTSIARSPPLAFASSSMASSAFDMPTSAARSPPG